MNRNALLALVVAGPVLLSGCAAAGALNSVASGYNTVRSGMAARSAYVSAKDLRNAEPVFSGFSTVMTYADIKPRENADELPAYFADNMRYLVDENARATGVRVQTCAASQRCGGRVLTVQFVEDGFNRNIVEKVTMGSKLRGQLNYIDAGTGQILHSVRIEGTDDYRNTMSLIHGSMSMSMLRTTGVEGKAAEGVVERVNAIEVIKPGYERVFDRS